MSFLGFLKKNTDYTGLIPKAEIMKKAEPVSAFSGSLKITGTGQNIDRFIPAELEKHEIEEAFKELGFHVVAVDYSVSGKTETHALYAPSHKLSSFLKESVMADLQGKFGLKDRPVITSLSGSWTVQKKPITKNIIELTVERENKIIAHLGDYLNSKLYWSQKGGLIAPLGHGSSALFIDLANMPHLLVVGTSGSGKSVFLESLLLSIHHRYTADDVQIALIDPKRVELVTFQNSPLMFHTDMDKKEKAFFTDAGKSIEFLTWLTTFIDRRYRKFADKKVKNIQEYNQKIEKIPYIICLIDEFAMLTEHENAAELFRAVRKITAEARAAGVVLIISTQTPNKDVIPVQIRTNLQSRIAFRIADKVDAESVVRIPEAFDLVGEGDGIYLDKQGRKHRFSGCFLDTKVDKLDDIITWDR